MTNAVIIARLIARTRVLIIAFGLHDHFGTQTIIATDFTDLAARLDAWGATEVVSTNPIPEAVDSRCAAIGVLHTGAIFAVLVTRTIAGADALAWPCT